MAWVDEFSQDVVELHDPSVCALTGRMEEREIVKERNKAAQRAIPSQRAFFLFGERPLLALNICNLQSGGIMIFKL